MVAQSNQDASKPFASTPAKGRSLLDVLSRDLPSGADELLKGYTTSLGSLGESKAIYLSTPITTGPRYLEWRKSLSNSTRLTESDYDLEMRASVMAENLRQVRPLRQRLRAAFPGYLVIDPTDVDRRDWAQSDYHRFWLEVIGRFVSHVAFADGWQYSTGCALEYVAAVDHGLTILDSDLGTLTVARALDLLTESVASLSEAGLAADAASIALERAGGLGNSQDAPRMQVSKVGDDLKDDRLKDISSTYNVATFVSFSPGIPQLRHVVVVGGPEPAVGNSVEDAIKVVLHSSRTQRVNIRTFRSAPTKSTPFFYELDSAEEAAARVREMASQGYFTIVNETIDIHDGGVSGVSMGGLAEFAPDDTPRAVERTGTASLPVAAANETLSAVYGTSIELPASLHKRYEFSVHPQRVGHRHSHLCLWEVEDVEPVQLSPRITWPNQFSKLIGDKTFGLIIAHIFGARVPETLCVPRRIAPFRFGVSTGSGETWLRTAPAEQSPGKFTTRSMWIDPFELLAHEDPDKRIAAVLAQEGVPSQYSGATLPRLQDDLIEGVRGTGERFMLGAREAGDLPEDVAKTVRTTIEDLRIHLGNIRIEWVFDGAFVWVLQLHKAQALEDASVISPGSAETWLDFDPGEIEPEESLERLRELIANAVVTGAGVLVHKPIGVTSHIGDLLRKSAVPARFGSGVTPR